MTRPTCFWNRCGWSSKGRDNTMKLRDSVTILLAVAALTLGWSPGLGAQPQPGGPLTVGLAADIAHFDIFHAIGYEAVWALENIHSGLVRVDPQGNIVPDMATSWDVNSHSAPPRMAIHIFCQRQVSHGQPTPTVICCRRMRGETSNTFASGV